MPPQLTQALKCEHSGCVWLVDVTSNITDIKDDMLRFPQHMSHEIKTQ